MLTLQRTLRTALPATIVLAMMAGAPASVHAQMNQDKQAQAQQNPGEWEWEADEGFHKEEWYDPSDWFDGDDAVDYEYDWGDVDEYQDEYGWYDTDHANDDQWYDGYWDGYYDGYNDDEYGFDGSTSLNSSYGDSYSSGYSDGYYNNDRGYTYDPYYYVVTWDYDNARQSERERAGDQNRSRGDRGMPSDRRGQGQRMGQNQGDAQGQRNGMDRRGQGQRMGQNQGDAQGQRNGMDRQGQGQQSQWNKDKARSYKSHEQRTRRVRGEVESIEYLRGTGSESGTPLIARVTFKEDGKKRVVNLGPKMSKDNVPFEKGDHVTFKGVRQQKNDRQVLTTHCLNVNGEKVTLAASPRWDKQGNRHAMKRMDGTIQSVSSADINSERYTMLKVQLRDGSTQIVAIPSRVIEDREDLDAHRGDRIRIEGRERTMNGRTVLQTERVEVNGNRLSMR